MAHTVTFDVGKTGCRAALFIDGHRQAETEQPGPRGVADPDGVAAADAAMTAAADLLAPGHVDSVCAGIAGLGRATQHAGPIAERLARRFPEADIVLTSDMTTSHAGALGGRPGVVVAAGTGTVALAIDTDGHAVCDGWGYLLGDAGSGYAIGRAGLVSALRHHDGRRGSAALHRAAHTRFGPLDALPTVVHQSDNPPRLIASFARDVAAAAEAGDPAALAIWRRAAQDLVEVTAGAAHRVFGEHPACEIATIGGLFSAGPLLTGPYAAGVAAALPASTLRAGAGDALDGAAYLAEHPPGPHEHLLIRRRAERP